MHPKGKGRSYSNPFPLSTAFEPIPPITTPVYTPAPIVLPRKHFDELLPHELQLHILVCLVDLHEEEHARRERDGKWTVLKASSSKNKWVGREQGVRELVRLSRVSIYALLSARRKCVTRPLHVGVQVVDSPGL